MSPPSFELLSGWRLDTSDPHNFPAFHAMALHAWCGEELKCVGVVYCRASCFRSVLLMDGTDEVFTKMEDARFFIEQAAIEEGGKWLS